MTGASITLTPTQAVEAVAHDEQMTVWAADFIGMLSLGDYLSDDLDYERQLDLSNDVKRELRRILFAAFDHPEARTIKRLYR
jgi:hypothetical protein